MASSVAAVLFLALAVVLVLRCKKKKNQKREAREPRVEEMNQVYGMYYFADGQHIDYETAEVQDDNEYYGK